MIFIQRSRLCFLLMASIIFAMIAVAQPVKAQAAATVGLLIREAEGAAESLINRGFDRLDMSMVQAGYEAQSTISAFRRDFEGMLEATEDTLDEQRSRAVSDLQNLTRALKGDFEDVLSEVTTATDRLTSTVVVLIDEGIGSVRILPGIGKIGDREFDVSLQGVALSQMKIEALQVSERDAAFKVVSQDDSRARIRVSVPEDIVTETKDGHPVELHVTFSVHKPRWFEFIRGRLTRNFATIAVFVPETVEKVSAVYVGEVEKTETKGRSESRGTPRVQTSVRLSGFPPLPELRRGSWSGKWTFTASPGGQIDTASIRHHWNGNSGCHGSSTRTRLESASASAIVVSIDIASDRKAGATCRATAIVEFSETFVTKTEDTHTLEQTEVKFGERTVFSRRDVPTILLEPRLAYVEITSGLFEDETKRVLPNEETEWSIVTSDPATGTDFVTVSLQRAN